MKKLFLLFILLFPGFIQAAGITGISLTHSREIIYPRSFTTDGITAVTVSVTGTSAYLAYPSATYQPAVLFTAQAPTLLGLTATASFVTPNDLVGGVGKTHFYALVGLSAVTNTAQLQGTFTQSAGIGLSNSASSITGFIGVTTTAGYQNGVNGLIPWYANNSIQAVELVTVSSTTTALTGLNVQPNRLMTVNVNRVAGISGNVYLYGLVMDYVFDPKLRR
jgi:hypothetical protein